MSLAAPLGRQLSRHVVTGAAGGVLRRAGLLIGVALVLGALVLPWRPTTTCLLRGLTGVPCPLCGGTTAMVQLGRGHLLAALTASPLALVAATAWVSGPAWLRRRRALLARLPRGTAFASLIAVLLASELWQLHRYGWLS